MRLAGNRTTEMDEPHLFGKISRDEAVEILTAARARHGYTFDGPIEEDPDA